MNTTEEFSININGKLFDEREKAGTILKFFYSQLKLEETIENHKRNLENSKLEYAKPFSYEEEYKTKSARQFKLNQELDLGRNNEEVVDEDENGV